MTRRRLRPDEVELWRQIAATTDRLHPELPRAEDPVARPKPKPHKTPKPRLPDFSIGQATRPATAAVDLKPALSDRLRTAPVSMDSKAFARMKRGKLVPEGRIDLHGMTMDRAHPARAGRWQAVGSGHHRQGSRPGRRRTYPCAPRHPQASGAPMACDTAPCASGATDHRGAYLARGCRGLLRVSAPEPIAGPALVLSHQSGRQDQLRRIPYSQNRSRKQTGTTSRIALESGVQIVALT